MNMWCCLSFGILFHLYICCRAAFVAILLTECTIFRYIFLFISHTLSSTSAWNDGRYTRYFHRFNNRNGVVDICIITFYRDKTSKHCPFLSVFLSSSLSIYCWFSCHCLVHTKYVEIHWIGISFGLAIKQTVEIYILYTILQWINRVCVSARQFFEWIWSGFGREKFCVLFHLVRLNPHHTHTHTLPPFPFFLLQLHFSVWFALAICDSYTHSIVSVQ